MSIRVLVNEGASDSASTEVAVDIVAIHGLYEDSLSTWRDPATGIIWLKDLVPLQHLKARVLLFTYSAATLTSPGGEAESRILPCATNLVAELCAERQLSQAFDRPILFICHGFGGIILKRALALSSTSRNKNIEHRRSIYVSTHAIIFMGTPHTGMSKDAILLTQRSEDAGPSQFTINLMKGSGMLQEVSDQFAPLMKQFQIYYIWEELKTCLQGRQTFIVDEESAAPPWHQVDRCGIRGTHSTMVKFTSQDSPGYNIVYEALVRYIRSASASIRSRWENDQKLLAEERQNEANALLQTHPSYSSADWGISSDINKHYIVPRCSSNYFTGRQVYSDMLKDKYTSGRRLSQKRENKVFVVYGLGGSGKTQFCLRYAEDHRTSYWGIFWIDASCEENAESGFAYLGQQAGKGATFPAGMHWLSNISEPWLLVIDNADDPEMDVSRYFPAGGNGNILVTTRNPGTVAHASVGSFHFQGMDPEEAVTLLLRSAHLHKDSNQLDVQSRNAAQGIASELGYLALALTHAGATIRRNIYTLERYLHHYLGSRKRMLSLPPIQSADDANIITTWEIPFRRIAARKSMEHMDAVDIFRLIAFLHFDSIPEFVFQRAWFRGQDDTIDLAGQAEGFGWTFAWHEENHARLRRALGILGDYSIIDHDPEKELCSLHPVVHKWARDRLSVDEQKHWLTRTAFLLAEGISPQEASGRASRRLLLPHIESCVRALKSILPSSTQTIARAAEIEKFASVYAENSMWKQARTLQQEALDLRLKKQGKWHEDTLRAQSVLGDICWGLFDVENTIKIHVQVLRSWWWLRPASSDWIVFWKPEHTMYCKALSDITLSLWLAGKTDLSKRAGERAVAGFSKRLGQDDPQTLTAMCNLARTYVHLEQLSESRELLRIVVRKRKHYFGSDHLDTLMARHELGVSLRGLGHLSAAERILSNVYTACKRTLGEQHAYTLWSMNDVAKVLCDRGRSGEAITMLENMFPTIKETLGHNHGATHMTRSNLARAYAISQKWSEAAQLLDYIISDVSEDYPMWKHAMLGYIHVLTKWDQPVELEKQCVRLLDSVKTRKILPKDDPRVLEVAQTLLRIYRDQKRDKDIEELRVEVPGLEKPRRSQTGLFRRIYGASTSSEPGRERRSVW